MLYVSTYLTLDGIATEPDVWHPRFMSPESIALQVSQLERARGMLIGRTTYEEFAAYWPGQDEPVPIGRLTNALAKFVVGHADPALWPGGPVEVIEGDWLDRVRELAAEDGEIFVPGSLRLVPDLLRAGLVDEVRVMLDPVLVGAGRQLFDPASGVDVTFDLVDQRSLPNGVHYLAYRPVPRTHA